MGTLHKHTHRPLAIVALFALLGLIGWQLPSFGAAALAYTTEAVKSMRGVAETKPSVPATRTPGIISVRKVASSPVATPAAVQQGNTGKVRGTAQADYNRLTELLVQLRNLKNAIGQNTPTSQQQAAYNALVNEINALQAKLGESGPRAGALPAMAAPGAGGVSEAQLAAGVFSPSAPTGTMLINGALAATDGTFNRPLTFSQGSACGASGVGTAVFRDVYEVQIAAAAQVTASLCSADGANASFDSFTIIYQAPGGAQLPAFSPTACGNAVAASDDVCGDDATLTGINAVAGFFYVVVTSFGNGTTGTYTLFINDGQTGGGPCTPQQILTDPGLEATDSGTFTNPNWPSTSTTFGSSLCSVAGCGNGGGTAGPRGGTFWAWFGGAAGAAETGTISQTKVIPVPPAGGSATLEFYLWIGSVASPFTDVLNVKVDGTTVATITEPGAAEAGYTKRSFNVSSFANGASHVITLQYVGVAGGGNANFSVDDASLTINCTAIPPCGIVCPANITVSNPANQCGATVTYAAPTTTGVCNAVTCTPPSGSVFPKGTTTVTCTSTGNINGAQTCSFTVTVNDTQPPAITCPPSFSVGTTGSTAVVNYAAPTASDNCPGIQAVTCAPASGSAFPVGVTTVTCTVRDAVNNSATCSFQVTVNRVGTPSITDPLACTGPGNVLTGTYTISNNGAAQISVVATVTLPVAGAGIPGLAPGTPLLVPVDCAASIGNCNPITLGYTGTLGVGQTATISYQVQVNNGVPTGTPMTVTTAVSFGGGPPLTVGTTVTTNCTAIGPGPEFPARSEVSDQKPGSILFYPIYTSAVGQNNQNSRISITNVHQNLNAFVHLFFVADNCAVSDAFICLTPNQTSTFLASDMDPGTTGYLVAVAVDGRTGCPVNFNYLIGDEYVKFASGHAANLAAEGIGAIAGGLPFCNTNSILANLRFDGISYNRLPTTLALDNLGSRADGNDTMLIMNSVGGDLRTGPNSLASIFGVLYDDSEAAFSFTIASSSCQFRMSITNTTPRTTPRFDQVIPAGRAGWIRLWHRTGAAILGAAINFNSNTAASSGAFTGGHNLHKLTLTDTGVYTVPVFPPTC